MSQGTNGTQVRRMYRDQVAAITSVFEQHQVFFGARIPYLYEQLGSLVHRCRQLQRLGKRAQARQLLDEELYKLFGVTAEVADDRPLSVLAGVMRHVLISGVRLQQPLAITNEVSFAADEVGKQMGAAMQGGGMTLLVLDARLNHLAGWLPEHVSLLEMRYFARLGLRDTGRELGIAVDLIKRELRFARAVLARTCSV